VSDAVQGCRGFSWLRALPRASRDPLFSMKAEIQKVIVGQDHVVDELFMALFCRGHCLLIGVPGLAKTLMISTLSKVLSLVFNRIQFTPDLMPSDITGTEVIQEDKATGAASSSSCRARSSPTSSWRTRSTARRRRRRPRCSRRCRSTRSRSAASATNCEKPFFVLATQNPIEQEGTYPLPEAQLDRFMFMVKVDYPSADEEREILRRTTEDRTPPRSSRCSAPRRSSRCRRSCAACRSPTPCSTTRCAHAATRLTTGEAPAWIKEWLQWGAGPRASQNLVLGAKAHALLQGRFYVAAEDIRAVAKPVLRHRLITSFAAEADGVTTDKVVERLLEETSRTTARRSPTASCRSVIPRPDAAEPGLPAPAQPRRNRTQLAADPAEIWARCTPAKVQSGVRSRSPASRSLLWSPGRVPSLQPARPDWT
jgi:MoxR-like ATPase